MNALSLKSVLVVAAGIAVGGLAVLAVPVWAAEQPPRWIKADDLRVRAGPGLDQRVTGVLQRGAEVILKSPDPFDGFCLIEGDGQYGYVACQYLSADVVNRPRAGLDGVPGDHRWVTGISVNLRAGPARENEVVSRLAVNRMVKLVRADAGAGYCEVQPLSRDGNAEGASGYTACQYLGLEPLPAAQAAGFDEDPVRAFSRSPNWVALENYAQALTNKLPDVARAGPWPRDEALERMKAHLALGLKGVPPPPLADWAQMKAMAAAHDPTLLSKAVQTQARSGADKDLQRREYRASGAAYQLETALGLYGPLYNSISSEGGGERVLRLMRALELPTVRPSFFSNEAEVGPPGDRTQELAGRFGGIYRTIVAARKPLRRDEFPFGLYDMFSRTEVLTRPVQFVRLFRDGTLKSEATTASTTELLRGDVDEAGCGGWFPGFAYGDADVSIWRYFKQQGIEWVQPPKIASKPPRLFAYHALQPPPRAKAQLNERTVKLDRATTGFVRLTQLGYDLDGDGVLDLMVLEGVGPGPGHLEGPTTTDDPWYRLLLANVGGAWKVLGPDTFGYGCGC